ncbi:MAG: ECF-type sigma factor [Planctomycetota bacterium]
MDNERAITRLLDAASEGDSRAASDLLPLVYDQLRHLAAARMRRLAPGQTLEPTALVHEAYLRIIGDEDPGWENRGHFFFAAARAMKNILIEQARRKAALKRGGDRKRVDPASLDSAIAAPFEDMLVLDEALEALENEKPRLHQLVLLRFFAGLSIPQTAMAMGVSERTLERDWKLARIRIAERLDGWNESLPD